MILNVDKNIVLKQLELTDTPDIFNTIDTQREHLGPEMFDEVGLAVDLQCDCTVIT